MTATAAATIAAPPLTDEQRQLFRKLATDFGVPLEVVKDYAEGQRRFLLKMRDEKRKAMWANVQFQMNRRAPLTEIVGERGIAATNEISAWLLDRKRLTDFVRQILQAMAPPEAA